MLCILYTRVSSDEQTRGTSLATQFEVLTDYARNHGYAVAGHYEDAESAKTAADRPALVAALNHILKAAGTPKAISALLVYKYDRLARKTLDGLKIRADLKAKGCRVISISEPADDTPSGNFLSTIMLAAAELDNAQRSERVVAGMQARLSAGYWVAGTPYGFLRKPTPSGLTLIPHPDIAPAIANALQAAADGKKSIPDTIATLRRLGIPKTKAHHILRSPIYGGIIRPKNAAKDIPAAFPGLISSQSYYALETKLNATVRHFVRHTLNPNFPFLNLISCSVCGSRLSGGNCKSRTGKKYAYYWCYKNKCTKIRADKFHAQLRELVANSQKAIDAMAGTIEKATKAVLKDQKQAAGDSAQIRRDLTALDEKATKVSADYAAGKLDDNAYTHAVAAIRARRCQLNGDLLHADTVDEYADIAQRLRTKYADPGAIFDALDPEGRRALIQLLFPRLALQPDGTILNHAETATSPNETAQKAKKGTPTTAPITQNHLNHHETRINRASPSKKPTIKENGRGGGI